MFWEKFYSGFVCGTNWLRHPLLLIIRLYWGALLVQSGFGKWMHIDNVASYFEDLHLPMPFAAACIVATIELVGGLSLIAGFLTRIFSLLLVILLFGAYVTANYQALAQIFTDPTIFIAQEPFLFLYAALIVLCFGPGMFSFDYWLEKKCYGNTF